MNPEVETVLVPVDGSEASATAAEYAVEVAERYGADVHALFVFDDDSPDGDGDDANAVDADYRTFLEDVRTLANDRVVVSTSTVRGFSTQRKSQHPGSVILDRADEVGADFVVVPREGVSSADPPGAVLEKVAEYVLLYASQPVLSV